MSSDLWSFSLTLYARPGVEQACLDLQSAGATVCLLLCAAWLEQRGVTFSQPRLERLRQVATPWDRDVVQPLRALRTRWKPLAQQDAALDELRQHIKGMELEAERELLRRLEIAAQDWPRGEAKDQLAWLDGAAAEAADLNRDALHRLRVAVTGT